MKNLLKIIIVLSLFFASCEKSSLVEIDLQNEEYIVIRSEVRTGEDFSGVNVTKTLPVGSVFDIKQAEVKNAFMYVRKNGTQVVPLHYEVDGQYKPLYPLRIREGDSFELFGRAEGREFYSKTIAPYKPVVASVNYNVNNYFDVNVQPFGDQVYGAVWYVNDVKADDYYSIEEANKELPFNQIRIRTETLPEQFQSPVYNGQRFVRVFSFDKAFLDYFQTKGQNLPVENSYVQNSGYIKWNVTGDHVIGLFIGIAEGELHQ